MDVNEWISYECSDEGTYTRNISYSSTRVHMQQNEKIAQEIAAKIAIVNGPIKRFMYKIGNHDLPSCLENMFTISDNITTIFVVMKQISLCQSQTLNH